MIEVATSVVVLGIIILVVLAVVVAVVVAVVWAWLVIKGLGGGSF